jgi:carbon monoxide dehydrogenase subunit G
MPVPPEAIWDVLAEPESYGYWVAGSKAIRDVEPEWPAPGSKFHHTIGFGPLSLADHTVALETERPHRFRLRAKGRPAGTATVTLELARKDGGTLVTMSENPDGVFVLLALNPLLQVFTRSRNAESLMRLEELALLRA